MFNGTKRRGGTFGYECLIWGMMEAGHRVGKEENAGEGHNCRTKRGIKEGMDKSPGGGSKGLWPLRAPGTAYRKGRVMAVSLSLVWGR